jgi:hypothetical protein
LGFDYIPVVIELWKGNMCVGIHQFKTYIIRRLP